MASLNVGGLGEYLREQRRSAQLSLRQLADAAGVSNPYLSQIERGLRKPSAEILQQLAKALRISAETLYVQAGILDERDRDGLEVRAAILAEPLISEKQKQVLLQIYESFRKEAGAAAQPSTDRDGSAASTTQASSVAPDGTAAAEAAGRPSRTRGSEAARKAAKKAAAKVADAVAEAVAETVGSRSRALKTVPSHDDDRGDTKSVSSTSGNKATRSTDAGASDPATAGTGT